MSRASESYKLNWGMWMEITPLGVQRQIAPPGTMGILLGEFKNTLVRIVKVGQVTSYWYAREFWQPVKEEHLEDWF